jgi:hypothetical protein
VFYAKDIFESGFFTKISFIKYKNTKTLKNSPRGYFGGILGYFGEFFGVWDIFKIMFEKNSDEKLFRA